MRYFVSIKQFLFFIIMNATFSWIGLAVFLIVSVCFTLKNLVEALAQRKDIPIEQSSFLFNLYHHLTYISLLVMFVVPPVNLVIAGWKAVLALGLLIINYALIELVVWKLWLFLIFLIDHKVTPYGKFTAVLIGIPKQYWSKWADYYCDKYKNQEACP